MPVQVQTSLMVGGLDLATPPIAMQSGKVISCINYEPDVAGYTSSGGFEGFDGRPSPSDGSSPADIANRRTAIQPVPGVGPVRGVWVYNGYVYAFRDIDGSYAGMYRSSAGGWEIMPLGSNLQFFNGSVEFVTGTYVAGATSNATAFIERVILRSGAWDGSAAGYLIVSNVTGTFVDEVLEQSGTPAADGIPLHPVKIAAGGRYDFTNNNFYGAADRPSMYFASGADTAFEWNGSVLTPIFTGVSSGDALSVVSLLAPPQPPTFPDDFTIYAADTVSPIIMSALFDAPSYVAHFKNHLFLGFASGSLINSSLGEPLEYITTSGAGEISFGEPITGLLTAASTSLMIFAQNRIGYLTGNASDDFIMSPLSDSSGAQPYTAQMMDTPMFLDDAGVRSLPTTAAFGDWRMATVTQLVEKLIRQKRDTPGVNAVASMRIKAKDQYRLFWDDGTGITVYIGRKYPETLPFKLPIAVFCACSGEVDNGKGDRLFVGAEDGYVYEMNRGTSYNGADIQTYLRLPFTAAKSPMQDTRWLKATFEIDSPDDIDIGVAFDVDYARGLGGSRVDVEVDGGTAIVSTDLHSEIDWTQPVEGRLEFHLSGYGPNIAATLITEADDKQQHTISAQTYNFSRRRLRR